MSKIQVPGVILKPYTRPEVEETLQYGWSNIWRSGGHL